VATLPASDLDRLRAATRHPTVDPTRSLFGPTSVSWRVNREAVILLGGGRALLLQVAHPLVAAGVAAHSRYKTDPLRRLQRTLDLMLTLVFSDAAAALAAVQEIQRVHARVRGVLAEDAGPFPGGTPYDASDPHLALWVQATLVETALLVYERFVEPLPPAARAAYYEESKVGFRLFGVPESSIPATLADFEEYVAAMVGGDVLAVSAESREIAASILRPPMPLGVREAMRVMNLFTVGLLPPAIRARYDLAWGIAGDVALGAVAAGVRTALPFVPELFRLMPHARRAHASER
jgi:uncharacterized protein (DUF2236 family)